MSGGRLGVGRLWFRTALSIARLLHQLFEALTHQVFDHFRVEGFTTEIIPPFVVFGVLVFCGYVRCDFPWYGVLERFDPTPFAHRFQPVARVSSNMVVSTRRGKGRSRKSTPPISPALNAISVDIKNSLFCTTPKGIDASDEKAVKGKSSRGFSYAASSSYIAEDIVAEDNSLDGSHTCTNENGGGFGLSADNSKDSIPFPVLARDPSSPPPQDEPTISRDGFRVVSGTPRPKSTRREDAQPQDAKAPSTLDVISNPSSSQLVGRTAPDSFGG
ncbi:hypothetical protein NL676_001791 [Syzygium grande]|nr:hypothetical protein NL676_001791 [Syzygium grande]